MIIIPLEFSPKWSVFFVSDSLLHKKPISIFPCPVSMIRFVFLNPFLIIFGRITLFTQVICQMVCGPTTADKTRSLWKMRSRVLAWCEQLEILKSIVGFYVVDVMHNLFAGNKSPSEMSFHHNSMLAYPFAPGLIKCKNISMGRIKERLFGSYESNLSAGRLTINALFPTIKLLNHVDIDGTKTFLSKG